LKLSRVEEPVGEFVKTVIITLTKFVTLIRQYKSVKLKYPVPNVCTIIIRLDICFSCDLRIFKYVYSVYVTWKAIERLDREAGLEV
jgi:hypothetical protein